MRIARVRWRRQRVPFARTFRSAHGDRALRDLVVCAVETEDGRTGWGEASPWPRDGDEVRLAYAALAAGAPVVSGATLDDALTGVERLADPAVRFALETALFDVQAQADGVTIAGLLEPAAATRVACNALVDALAPDDAAAVARDALVAGFATLKIKVGGAPASDAERVAAVRAAAGPAVRLRVDANGAWTRDEALHAHALLAPYGVEYVEQPCTAIADLAALRSAGMRVAADESAADETTLRDVLAAHAADVIVLKPAVVGGLRAARRLASFAAAAGVETIVTSSIESGIGIAAALHLAAAVSRSACGLATAALLADDLTAGVPAVTNGTMRLPAAPGLGVVPDAAAIEHYAHGPWAST